MDAVVRMGSSGLPFFLTKRDRNVCTAGLPLAPSRPPAILDHVSRALPFLVINLLPVGSHLCLPRLLARTARSASSTCARRYSSDSRE